MDGVQSGFAGGQGGLHLIAPIYAKAMERHKKAARLRTKSPSVTLAGPSQLCDNVEIWPGIPYNLPNSCTEILPSIVYHMKDDHSWT